MRIVQLTLLITVLVPALHGQGTLIFANRLSSNVWARVYDCDGLPLSGTNFSAQLFAGPLGSTESQLQPVDVPVPFRTGPAAGSWLSREVKIPSVPPTRSAVLQVRVRDTRADVSAAGAGAAAGKLFLRSSLFNSLPLGGGDPPLAAPRIVGNKDPANNLQSFDCSGDLPIVRIAGAPTVSGSRLQIEFEVAATSLDRVSQLHRARSPEGPWLPDLAATLQKVSTNYAYWKYRFSTAAEGAAGSYFQISAR